MGIEATYRRITPAEWDDLRALADADGPPSEAELEEAYIEFADSDAMLASDRYFSLDKEWLALHALLTGDLNPSETNHAPPPLGNVVLGGTETRFPGSYGPIRVLKPDEVREVAAALSSISADDLRARFDPAAFNQAQVYPNPRPGGWNATELEPLLHGYPRLVSFFREADAQGNFVLLALD